MTDHLLLDDWDAPTCEWERGPNPASGCDNPATDDGLCPEHSRAYAALTGADPTDTTTGETTP